MKDQVQTEEAPRIEIGSQTTNDLKIAGQKRGFRVLHVDDDPCILQVSKEILELEGNFEVDTALSVDEAYKKMEKQTYDAVVSDYEMPLRNGLDFLKELREQQKDVPFILFTGKGREEVVVNALNLGADSYINKHGSPETVYCELAHAINKTVERKKSREALVASESKYRTLVEKSLQGILVTIASPLRLVFANEAMGKFLGYSAKELTSLSPEGIMGLVYHEDRAVFFRRMENRFRGEPAESCLEFRAVRKDGSIIWLNAFANRVDYDGQPAVLGMFLDVDESKKTGEILRESEQRYRELANSLPEIVFETDINGQLAFANERAAEISGYSQKELEKGLNVLQFLVPEDRERATENIQRLLAGGRYAPAEYTFARKDGTTFPALITVTPCISKGKVTGLRGVAFDITERKKAEEKIARLASFPALNPNPVVAVDLEGNINYVNSAAERAFPDLKKAGLNHPFFSGWEQVIAVFKDEKQQTFDRDIKIGDVWFHQQLHMVPETRQLRLYVTNITEAKKTEKELRVSEEKYRGLFESTQDGIVFSDAEGVVVSANQAAAIMLGYKNAKELVNVPAVTLWTDPQDRRVLFELLAKKGTVKDYEVKLKRKDGKTLDVRVTVVLQRDLQGNVLRSEAILRDITEYKRVEQTLKESEEKYRRQFMEALDAIFVADAETGILVDCNPAACELVGREKTEIVGMHQRILHPPEKSEGEFSRTFKERLGKKKGQTLESQVITKSGEIKDVAIKASIFTLRNKTLMQGSFRDITEQKKVEKALREAEEKYRETIVNANVGIIAYDPKGEVKILNPKMEEMTGFTSREIPTLTKWFEKLYPNEEERSKVRDKWFKRMSEEGEVKEGYAIITAKEGKRRNFLFNGFQLKSGDFTAFAHDITERKEAEEELKRSNASLVEAQNIAHLGSWEWNIETNQEFWSDELYSIYGYDNQSFQPTPDTFLKALHPDDYLNVVNAAKRAFREKRRYDIECRIRRPNGEILYLHCQGEMQRDSQGKPVRMVGTDLDITERKKAEQAVSASLNRYQSFIDVTGELGWITNAAGEVAEDIPSFRNFTGQTYDEVKGWGWTKAVHPDDLEHATQAWQAAVAAKTKYEVEYRLRGWDNVYRNFMVRGAPIFEEDGQIREWVGTCIDITDRKKAEEALDRTMEEMVRVNEKLGVVGSLTRHDVRNKLCAVTANAFIIKKKHADQPDIMDGLGKMEQAVKDVMKIFDFAKTYEQLGVEELTYIDMEKTLNESAALFSGPLNIQVINDCHGLTLLADSFLRQLFYNLIDNSLKHGEKVTRIRVHYEQVDQDKLNVVYEDNGVGIPALDKPNLFKEGFSTGGSSGYGLYLIRKMIQVYGWDIQENGAPSEGARFTITIPKINQKGKENFQIA